MNEIYKKFEAIFSEELSDLLIGHPFNEKRMNKISNCVSVIYYFNNSVDLQEAVTLLELLK